MARRLSRTTRLPGQYANSASGLHYNYFPDYDSSTGRYIQSDLIGLNGVSFSTFSYLNGKPLDDVDVFGLAGGRGERGATGGSSGRGSNNPYKNCRHHPTDPNKIECKHHHQSGKWIPKPKPADWDQYKSCPLPQEGAYSSPGQDQYFDRTDKKQMLEAFIPCLRNRRGSRVHSW